MLRKLRLFKETILQEGWAEAIAALVSWLRDRLTVEAILSAIKLHESKKFKKSAQSQILAGPFVGVKLEKLSWGRRDFVSYSAGSYEIELLEYFERTKKSFKTFLDIGAADGYYVVSLVKKDFFQKAHAFEISQIGRNNISYNASINNVSDKIDIHGEFNYEFLLKSGKDFDWATALILSDIEGAEFELFDTGLLRIISPAHLLIELHTKNRTEAEASKFLNLMAGFYHVSVIESRERDIYKFIEYNPISEDMRYLMHSDGRYRGRDSSDLPRGKWLLCCPNALCKIC